MINENIKFKLKRNVNSLISRYELFFSNYKNKNLEFKSEKEYESIQLSLSKEIQIEELKIKDILKKYFLENFPDIKFLLYDSRTVCQTETFLKIGEVLLKDVPDDLNKINNIREKFINDFGFNISIMRIENLPIDQQEKLLEII